MKKLTLQIDQLRVDTYDVGAADDIDSRGTVHGNSTVQQGTLTYTGDFTCDGSTCGSPTNAVRCK